jgi:putative transposase
VRRSRSFGRVERLTARPDMLEAENAQLRAANAELKRRRGMNSRNSVKPPSTDSLNYLAWQKNFPRSVRDRAPGLLVEVMRRKAESAGGDRLYEFNTTTTALSQTCLCGNRTKKPLSQRVHRCGCGITEDRHLFSAYLGLHVHPGAQGFDRLDLQAANHGWLHRHDVDGRRGPAAAVPNRRGRRHPQSRRSVARIKARRQAKAAMRQSRSARTSATNQPTALAA